MDNVLAFIMGLLLVSVIFLLFFVLLSRGRRGPPGPPGPPYFPPWHPHHHHRHAVPDVPAVLTKPLLGGCSSTRYGCCPNGVTAKANTAGTNCWL